MSESLTDFNFKTEKDDKSGKILAKFEIRTIDWKKKREELKLFVKTLPFKIHSATIGIPYKHGKKESKIGFLITPYSKEILEYIQTKWIKELPREFKDSSGIIFPIYVETTVQCFGILDVKDIVN